MCGIDTVAVGSINVPQQTGDTCTCSQNWLVQVSPMRDSARLPVSQKKGKLLSVFFT